MDWLVRSRIFVSALALAAIGAGAMLALSCKREARQFEVPTSSATPASQTAVTDFYAGGPPAEPAFSAKQPATQDENNAYALSEGKRLFDAYNCTGCHAHGGGGMGPALMDNQWIYGGRLDQIFTSIAQGRPNGMPHWGGKIPDAQIWELAAFVRSLSVPTPVNAGQTTPTPPPPPAAPPPAETSGTTK
jgi:cytochrome c oxidase cbb3-type subunit 3